MATEARRRYDLARKQLEVVVAAATPDQFLPAFLSFLTLARSVFDVARDEGAAAGQRGCIKPTIDSIEKEELVRDFIEMRNTALKRGRYRRTRSTLTITPAPVVIRFSVGVTDVLIRGRAAEEPESEPDELKPEIEEDTPTIEARRAEDEAEVNAIPRLDFFFAGGKYDGRNVGGLSGRFLKRVEEAVEKLEECLNQG